MILSDIRTQVRRLVGEPTASANPFWTNSEIDDAIHDGEIYVGSIILLPEKKQTFLTVANQREYTTLSAGTYTVKALDYDGEVLDPTEYRETIDVTEIKTTPREYFLRQSGRQITVGLYPTPTAVKQVTCLTSVEPIKPGADGIHSEIPDMWVWAIKLFAGMQLKMKDREFREGRAMVDEMLRDLLSASLNVKRMQRDKFKKVHDVRHSATGIYRPRVVIP